MRLNRRKFLVGAASVAALGMVGCGGAEEDFVFTNNNQGPPPVDNRFLVFVDRSGQSDAANTLFTVAALGVASSQIGTVESLGSLLAGTRYTDLPAVQQARFLEALEATQGIVVGFNHFDEGARFDERTAHVSAVTAQKLQALKFLQASRALRVDITVAEGGKDLLGQVRQRLRTRKVRTGAVRSGPPTASRLLVADAMASILRRGALGSSPETALIAGRPDLFRRV